MTKISLIEKYIRSQQDLGVPNDLVLGERFNFSEISKKQEASNGKTGNYIAVSTENNTKTPETEETLPVQNFMREISVTDKREELAKLFYKCKTCDKCSLSKTRKKFVFGAGTAYSDILVIGEAPGADEDEKGLPFVGAAGQLLTKMLAAINLERDKIFIANILKCRPPQNRKPNSAEIATCIGILKKQIEIINPKAILLLGATAANTILGNEKSVGSLRGIVHYYNQIPAIVSYHPSALLRDASYKKPAWDDLQRFERLLKEIKNG